jgi:hypothetical protein
MIYLVWKFWVHLISETNIDCFYNLQLVCMSQYQVRQILDNLPTHAPSDEDTDTSFCGESDLTSAVGMIYSSKVSTNAKFILWLT